MGCWRVGVFALCCPDVGPGCRVSDVACIWVRVRVRVRVRVTFLVWYMTALSRLEASSASRLTTVFRRASSAAYHRHRGVRFSLCVCFLLQGRGGRREGGKARRVGGGLSVHESACSIPGRDRAVEAIVVHRVVPNMAHRILPAEEDWVNHTAMEHTRRYIT